MDRAEKENWVASLHRTFSETAVVLVAHYSGLTVAEIGDLRKRMRDTGAGLRVTKNRLTRLALADTQYRSLEGLFKGPTAIAFANDPVGAAKVAVGYAKSNPKLVLLGGSVGGHLLDAEGVRTLATLPSLDELRGQLIGLLNAPATRIAGILQAPAGQLARVLSAWGKERRGLIAATSPTHVEALGVMTMPNLEQLADQLSSLTVLEAAQLSKMLEEKWGVSAAAPVAVAAAAPAAAAVVEPAEEQTEFDVVLTAVGDKKINVIKEVRAVTSLGLKEAKDLVESAPKTVKEAVKKEEAEQIKKKLEEAGATVEIK